ncbi:MAG TPA: hypothetical protein VLA68_03390 [Nitrososphaera sp.]|nr:hypothetical protein [Nitrososphaera sp.]
MQLYFREPVLNTDKLDSAFGESAGFSSHRSSDGTGRHPMQNTMSFFRQGFKIAPVQSNVLPFRILQVMSYPNALQSPDSETIDCLHHVVESLKQHLGVNIDKEIYTVRVVYHSIVTGSQDVQRMLSKLTRIDRIPSLAGRYVGHKNPMDAIQLTSRTGGELSQESWSDIRVSQFNTNSYVVTIFNETDSLAASLEFIRGVKQWVATLMEEMEQAAAAVSGP